MTSGVHPTSYMKFLHALNLSPQATIDHWLHTDSDEISPSRMDSNVSTDSAVLLEKQWQQIFDWFHGDEFNMAIWGTSLVTMGVYWGLNFFFVLLDYTGRPKILLKYKVQLDQNAPVDGGRLSKAVLQVLFNQTVVSAPFFLVAFQLMKWRGCSFERRLPTLATVASDLVVMILVEEVLFYYTHRILHHPRLYKRIHKVHHEWTAPIGVVAIYAHPVEHVISNLSPPILGVLICGSHIATAWIWFAMCLASTIVSHCGYHLPFLFSPEAHDFHHAKFNQNFGVLGLMDWVHGTDKMFKRSIEYERNFMLFTMMPVRRIVPDKCRLHHD